MVVHNKARWPCRETLGHTSIGDAANCCPCLASVLNDTLQQTLTPYGHASAYETTDLWIIVITALLATALHIYLIFYEMKQDAIIASMPDGPDKENLIKAQQERLSRFVYDDDMC